MGKDRMSQQGSKRAEAILIQIAFKMQKNLQSSPRWIQDNIRLSKQTFGKEHIKSANIF